MAAPHRKRLCTDSSLVPCIPFINVVLTGVDKCTETWTHHPLLALVILTLVSLYTDPDTPAATTGTLLSSVTSMAAPQQQSPQLRNLFQRRDVLQEISDTELIKRYRLDRDGILFITNLVRDALSSKTRRRNPLTPEMKVILTLRYLATGRIQMYSRDYLDLSQPAISRAITQTLDALADVNILKQFICLPITPDAIAAMKADFSSIADFPKVIGVINGTHVRLMVPKEDEWMYVNSRGYNSINVQVVFDANCRIMDILAKWPGSLSKAQILSRSGVTALFERGHVPPNSYLLGDRGYTSKPWLLTPYQQPLPGPQTRYNRAHKETWSVVERGIEQLKRRFHVLHSEVRLSPPVKVCKMIHVCGMLHNICKDRNIPIPFDVVQPDFEERAARQNQDRLYEDEFCKLHFSNED